MHIVARDQLTAVLTSDMYDPEQDRQEEFAGIAAAVLANAPESVQWFVITDHENGADPEVSYGDHWEEVLPLTYAANGEYYGVDVQRHFDLDPTTDDRRVYNCYLGGSSLSSAPGFVISTASM